MADVCIICLKALDKKDVISVCSGKCGSVIHLKCSEMKESEKKSLIECDQLHWMCNKCDKVEVSTFTVNIINKFMTTVIQLVEQVKQLEEKIDNMKNNSACKCSSNITTSVTELSELNANPSIPSSKLKQKNKQDLNEEEKVPKDPKLALRKEKVNITLHRGKYSRTKDSQVSDQTTEDENTSMPNLTRQLDAESIYSESDSKETETKEFNKNYSEVVKENGNSQSAPQRESNSEYGGWRTAQSSRRVKKKAHKRNEMIIGMSQTSEELVGVKKAWLHLGKLQRDTTTEQVEVFLKKNFPNVNITVSKLESKGNNCSFRLGVDFAQKDTLMNSNLWPQNITLRRFLFPRRVGILPQ
ncbi:hypothetical protein O3M35_004929 [Rhynocoris fuscipes]|uniref:PHD-type domain-containing protein n=1 Tax=Rhynocoris fuscipes TaxID=488301 RepID=A0AAW1DLN2_9HEMI